MRVGRYRTSSNEATFFIPVVSQRATHKELGNRPAYAICMALLELRENLSRSRKQKHMDVPALEATSFPRSSTRGWFEVSADQLLSAYRLNTHGTNNKHMKEMSAEPSDAEIQSAMAGKLTFRDC